MYSNEIPRCDGLLTFFDKPPFCGTFVPEIFGQRGIVLDPDSSPHTLPIGRMCEGKMLHAPLDYLGILGSRRRTTRFLCLTRELYFFRNAQEECDTTI